MHTSTAAGRTATGTVSVVVGIVLVAFNLRAGIAAVSPLLPDIRDDLGISRGAAGLLTTLPVLCFGALSTAAAGLGRRIGSDRAVVLGMLVLAVASGVRLLPSAAWFFAGTVVLGAAITIGNVLTPTLVKEHIPGRHVGSVTGLYTGALIGGAAVAAAISAPLASTGLGWRGALLVWAVPAGGRGRRLDLGTTRGSGWSLGTDEWRHAESQEPDERVDDLGAGVVHGDAVTGVLRRAGVAAGVAAGPRRGRQSGRSGAVCCSTCSGSRRRW